MGDQNMIAFKCNNADLRKWLSAVFSTMTMSVSCSRLNPATHAQTSELPNTHTDCIQRRGVLATLHLQSGRYLHLNATLLPNPTVSTAKLRLGVNRSTYALDNVSSVAFLTTVRFTLSQASSSRV